MLSVLLVLFAWRLLRRAARRSRAQRGVCDDLHLQPPLSLAEVARGEAPDVNRKAGLGASASSSCNIQHQDSLLLDTSGDYVSAQSYTSLQSLDALQAETPPSSINLSVSPSGNAVLDTSTSAAFVSFSATATVTSSSPPRATVDDQIVFASPEITSTSTPLLRSPVLPCTARVARQLLQRGLETFATEAELRVLYKWARLVTPVHLVLPIDEAAEYRTELHAPMDAKGEGIEFDPFSQDENKSQRRQKMDMWRGKRWG
ncbi:hypothetical protein R3P38DRAFT_2859513 [Favolaschia claudopus]|uniref:Uncharacterized protein n=1 Tax=Favolaschia claudopus TaxID=2862362 RepID=A0AAW0DHR8_9AGAR